MEKLARRQLAQTVVEVDGDVGMVIAHRPQGQLSTDLDIQWLLNSAYFVFFMQVYPTLTSAAGPAVQCAHHLLVLS